MAFVMTSQMTILAGLQALTPNTSRKLVNANSRLVATPRLATTWAGVRCEAGKGLREIIDETTREEITESEILKNMETNESEQRSYSGAKPTPGFDQAVDFTPRPEIEWLRGRSPPRRLPVLLIQQLNPATSRLVFFLGAVQLFTYASLVPIMNGESKDARSFGPFTARAER